MSLTFPTPEPVNIPAQMCIRDRCAVAQPHIYSETVVIAACAGGEFTTKGKTVKHPGWKALEDAYRAKMKDTEPKKEGVEKALPELTEGQTLSVSAAIVKEGKSSPPQHFTEDTLLSAMETAGKEDMPVSYTHLDVYKRQELYRIMTTKPQELKKKEDE